MSNSEVYFVEPLKPNIEEFSNIHDPTSVKTTGNYGCAMSVFIFVGMGWFCISAFKGFVRHRYNQSDFSAYGWIIAFIIAYIFGKLDEERSKKEDNNNEEKNYKYRKKIAEENSNKEAIETSRSLNKIISKTNELVNSVIPYYINFINQELIKCKQHLENRAINNYFDSVEETVKGIACFKDIVDDIKSNIVKYSNTLQGRVHNFPSKIPINVNDININEHLKVFHDLNYQADKTPEFALVYNQRKLIKVNIAGFQNLREGIDLASEKITASISDLSWAIRDSHERIIENQNRQLDSFKIHSKLQDEYQQDINLQLQNINNKLYYIQYDKKPLTPFSRPLFGD